MPITEIKQRRKIKQKGPGKYRDACETPLGMPKPGGPGPRPKQESWEGAGINHAWGKDGAVDKYPGGQLISRGPSVGAEKREKALPRHPPSPTLT